MKNITIMELEAKEAPDVVSLQIKENQKIVEALAVRLHKKPPPFAMTVARGSSDHAATYAKYLLETELGIITAGAAPSVMTLYGTRLYEKGGLVIGISQSGESPDICEMMEAARKGGALTVAIVNHEDSHMARTAEYIIPMHAGTEKAVAATKSYIASLTAILHIIAVYMRDDKLLNCLKRLPDKLRESLEMDWSPAVQKLKSITDTLVIARGYGFPVAEEASLKFKETAGIHAEAFSGAEVLHGPFALIKKKYPVLMFLQNDVSLKGMEVLAEKIRTQGAYTYIAVGKDILKKNRIKKWASLALPLPNGINPICDPIMAIQAFYVMIARLSVTRGYNPDAPLNLKKITMTI